MLLGVPSRQFSASIEFAGDVHELDASRIENADIRNVIDATVSSHPANPQSGFFMMKFPFSHLCSQTRPHPIAHANHPFEALSPSQKLYPSTRVQRGLFLIVKRWLLIGHFFAFSNTNKVGGKPPLSTIETLSIRGWVLLRGYLGDWVRYSRQACSVETRRRNSCISFGYPVDSCPHSLSTRLTGVSRRSM